FNSPDQVEYHYSLYKTIPGVGVKSVNDVLTINVDLNELLNNTKWMARFNSATIEFPNASNIDDYYLCIVGEPSFNDQNGKTLWGTKAALMTVGAIPNSTTTTNPNDNTPPGAIENLQINAIPGNNSYALVSWTNPSDSDFDGVEITWTPEGPASPVSRLSSFTSYQLPISWLSSKTIFITSKDASGNKGQVVQKSYTYNFINWDFDLSSPNATWQSAGFTPRIPGIADNWIPITPSLTTYEGTGAVTFSDQNKSTLGQSYALYFGINLPSGNFSNVKVRLRIWIDADMITQNKPEINAFISDNTYWLGTSPLLLSSLSPATPGWYWLEYDYSQISGSSSLLYNLTNPYLHFHLATEDGGAEGPFYVDKIEVDGSAPIGTTTSTTSTTTSTTTTSTTTTTLGPSGSLWKRVMPTSTNIFTM
ncbi:MAG TPA: hypothetical protein PLO89_11255, partial [Spirochaetota bacterium]|nr:hypothetical protein [Spirochaetota bacterium]